MEADACRDKESKHSDLYEQAGDDDMFAHVVHFQGATALNTTSSRLESESDDIARDEDLCDPIDRYHGEMLSVEGADESCEDHVNRGGEEGGRNEDQNRLHDEATERFLVEM